MGSRDSGHVWIDNSDGNVEYFVGLIQLISENVSTMFKSTVLVPYYVQAIVLGGFVKGTKY